MRFLSCRVALACLTMVSAAGICAASHDDDDDSTEGRYSQVTTKRYSTYVGVAAGTSTGYGISFRKWFGDRWGLQINALPVYHEEDYDDPARENSDAYGRDSGFSKSGDGSLGLAYLRRIADGRYIRVLYYAGGSWGATYRNFNYYATEREHGDSVGDWQDTVVHRSGHWLRNTVALGTGAGCEFYVWRFAFHVMLGLRGAYTVETQSPQIGPSGEAGIHFRF